MSDRRSATRRESERVPPEPDLHDDLGYELCDLESYETDEGRILVLPESSPRIRGPSTAGPATVATLSRRSRRVVSPDDFGL